jgi:hypothetical protein
LRPEKPFGASYYWPPGVPYEETVSAFIQAYGTLGYFPCPHGDPEPGFEKVVLFALNGAVKHAARQLVSGLWSSKMGAEEDIEHVLNAVEGPAYGTPVQFLKRLVVNQPSAASAGTPAVQPPAVTK